MDLRHLFLAVLAIAIGRDQFHRPGAIKSIGRDEVFEPVRAHFHEQIGHPAGFKLEYALGLSLAEHL